MDFVHIPVLLHEVLEGLAIRPDGIYVDGTVGGAGHSTEIAKRLTAGGKLIGFDRDPDAVEVATQRLAPYPATVVHHNYDEMAEVLTARCRWMACYWIWEFLPTSWTRSPAVFPIITMHPWICV